MIPKLWDKLSPWSKIDTVGCRGCGSIVQNASALSFRKCRLESYCVRPGPRGTIRTQQGRILKALCFSYSTTFRHTRWYFSSSYWGLWQFTGRPSLLEMWQVLSPPKSLVLSPDIFAGVRQMSPQAAQTPRGQALSPTDGLESPSLGTV